MAPAQTITLVRHGQTERSARMAYSGRLDIPLTELGREQAQRAGETLTGRGIDAIITSPLVRARDTAQAIAAATGVALTVDERLTEIDYGVFEGMDRADARAKLGKPFEDWRNDPFGSPVAGMETLPDALASAQHPLLVGHQGILRIVLVALGRLAPEQYFTQRLKEAEPVVIRWPALVQERRRA